MFVASPMFWFSVTLTAQGVVGLLSTQPASFDGSSSSSSMPTSVLNT